ncbi:pro-sigmaK processing inhibitor BofA family protein [Tenuibacillus multivorans]|uniref:Inhibitor of the pro-sigma K processing machinery n=1 Tax=Tenuibacillus multivorans TaxID=237069 RepID=A0A1G9W2Y8_9BACI|nr:pro-sigmaK processing inhibitor BofA family protein [Tenuibacillus multivorans]GEL78284.1 sigma-K factor-processing regulatory protein BofA [Tenuibacillus multivorans]SDM78556.1 inhibitor of the pro-sigma K processing machinery [Tenuibacillus multivorans]
MDPIVIILAFVAVLVLLLFFGPPMKVMRWMSLGVVKIVIGALFIFFANVFGSMFGLHIPINFITSAIAGFLGLFGLGALVVIQFLIIP